MKRVVLLLLLGACSRAPAPAFDAVVLGAAGGLEEDNLTAVLLRPRGGQGFVLLDAGSVRAGVTVAQQRKTLPTPEGRDNASPVDVFIARHIKAVLVTHAHLDHVAGLVINSTDDEAKPLLGTATTLSILRDHVFNWKVWPNFGDGGTNPLGRYRFTPVDEHAVEIPGTLFHVETFPLSHGRSYASSAFLLTAGEEGVLFLGDTGPDALEEGGRLGRLWTRVAPLIRNHRLRALFIECSYSDGREDAALFGHLNPRWLTAELSLLAERVEDADAMKALTVVVMHIKPAVENGKPSRGRVIQELQERNRLGVKLVFPQQGDALAL
jgi:3',5'-cyclic-nucleotide phosphodiesterase